MINGSKKLYLRYFFSDPNYLEVILEVVLLVTGLRCLVRRRGGELISGAK